MAKSEKTKTTPNHSNMLKMTG